MNTAKPPLTSAATVPLRLGDSGVLNNYLLFIVGLSLAGSGFSVLRFTFLGLRVHTYLMVVGAFFPLLTISRLHNIPPRFLFEVFAFASLYFTTTIPGGVDAAEGIKMFAAVATIITMAMLVRNWDNFVVGILGMCLAVAILAIKGLEADVAYSAGIKALEEANRNTYSMYALPSILLGSYILVRGKPDPLITKLLIATSIIVSALVIVLSLNRSGWLGLGLISVLIIREKSLKAAVIFGIVGMGVFLLITSLFSFEHLQSRVFDTRRGLESDTLRWNLIKTSIQIGFENPMLGVSPQELPFVLAERLGYAGGYIAPHNVYAHLIAGCGIPALILFLHIGYLLWSSPPPRQLATRIPFLEARTILRLVLVLWAIRGCFTHEIIYSPGFCMAIGMALGLELSYGQRRTSDVPQAIIEGRRARR